MNNMNNANNREEDPEDELARLRQELKEIWGEDLLKLKYEAGWVNTYVQAPYRLFDNIIGTPIEDE